MLLNKFFQIVDTRLNCEGIARQSCAMLPRWRFFGEFMRLYFSELRAESFRPAS